MEKDLFEEVAAAAGCEYISDMKLKEYNSRAKKILAETVYYKDYSLRSLSDIYKYLYGKPADFENYGDVEAAFQVTK